MTPQIRGRARYPTPAKVRQAVSLARELGLDVAGFEMCADGTIRVIEPRAAARPVETDYDRWKDQL